VHILLLNEYYPPDTSATAKMAASFVEALALRHRVTVLAGRPSYDPTHVLPWRLLQRETRGNVTVERVGSTAFPRFKMVRRVCNYLSYTALAAIRALTIRADVVLCMTDPPFAGIVGAVVAQIAHRPFVYNIQDLYPEMVVGGNIVRSSRVVRAWEFMHRWALRSATRIIVIGEDMRERIIAKGIDPARVHVVRAGAPIAAELPAPGNPISQEVRSGFRFVALHAGNLGFYGAWETLLDAGKHLGNDGLGIIFVGEGAEKERLKTAAAETRAVRFLPFRPVEEVPHVLSAGDVHIITVKRGLEGVIVPSKLYPILAAGKPVLVVADPATDVARIVTRAACGIVVDPDDAREVAEAIKRLAGEPQRVADMGGRARLTAREYEKEAQLATFVSVLETALQPARGN
jgi:colanic acid biosynthesis glycosyl transferase WcaI